MARRKHIDPGFIDTEDLHAAVEATRYAKRYSRREAARQIGVSASTLTRLAQGRRPGVDNAIKIGTWIGPLPAGISRRARTQPLDLLTMVRRHLRESNELDRTAAGALMRILETAYAQVRSLSRVKPARSART